MSLITYLVLEGCHNNRGFHYSIAQSYRRISAVYECDTLLLRISFTLTPIKIQISIGHFDVTNRKVFMNPELSLTIGK